MPPVCTKKAAPLPDELRVPTAANLRRIGWTYEYRLGDVVLSPDHPFFPTVHCARAPRSMACEYLSAVANRSRRHCNLDVFFDIVRRRRRSAPRPVVRPFIAVHLRTGDVLDTPPWNGQCRRVLARSCYFAYSPCSYESIAPPLPAVLFTNASKGVRGVRNNPQSRAYVARVRAAMARGGRGVAVHPSRDADDDFLRMLDARYLVPARGGMFAHLLRLAARNFNVTVLAPRSRRCENASGVRGPSA